MIAGPVIYPTKTKSPSPIGVLAVAFGRSPVCAMRPTVAGSGAAAKPAATIAIIRVNVVDVVDGRILPNRTVTINGQVIESVAENVAPPSDARVMEAGKFLIPGLWDMHSHNQAWAVESLELYLPNRVIGTRDMGSDLEFILPLRNRIHRGELSGPEIVAAGPMLDNAPAMAVLTPSHQCSGSP